MTPKRANPADLPVKLDSLVSLQHKQPSGGELTHAPGACVSFQIDSGLLPTPAQLSQVKKIAAEYEVEDGPNDEGEMFERPAKPSDR